MTGRPGRTGKGASQASAGDLLELVRSGRAVTRGALQQATGLSRATVGQRLDLRLLELGLHGVANLRACTCDGPGLGGERELERMGLHWYSRARSRGPGNRHG